MGNWRTWLKGLLAAAIGGSANSLGAAFVDPVIFTDMKKLGQIAFMGAAIAVVMYLKKSPVPTEKIDEIKITRTVTNDDSKDQ